MFTLSPGPPCYLRYLTRAIIGCITYDIYKIDSTQVNGLLNSWRYIASGALRVRTNEIDGPGVTKSHLKDTRMKTRGVVFISGPMDFTFQCDP